MTIDQERPEGELDTARISELLTVVQVISARHHGETGTGVIPCPVCGGEIAYAISPGPSRARRHVRAVCNRSGCIRFMS